MKYSIEDLQNIIENAKNTKFLSKLRRQEEVKAKKKSCILRTVIIAVTAVAVLCAVAYFLYVYFCPAGSPIDEDLDDDFEGDFFEEEAAADDDSDDDSDEDIDED